VASQLRHANIVRLHTFIMTPNKYYLVMEYCEGGDLLQFINGTSLLSDSLARNLFRGLVEGIRFCHVLGIHHRDLKLENLMLTSREEATMTLKIADFGLSDLQVHRPPPFPLTS
jgi:serine/threonine protein kinase